MKISFLISAMVLYIVRQSFCVNIRVGTVLFTKSDLVRKCWSENDRALLRARLVMQDVLPDPSCIDFSKPRAVSIILDYIYACFHIINTSTYGKLQNLMYLALADVVGGYLRAYVLPLTKKSYYAGQISYEDACRVFTFYDQIRAYLKTDGAGWMEPQKAIYKNIKVSPLEIFGGNPKACNILYTIEKKGRLHYINAKCSPETSKLPDMKIQDVRTQSTTEGENSIFKGGFLYPTFSTDFSKSTPGIYSTPKTSNVSKAVKSGKTHPRETASEVKISTTRENASSGENKLRGNIRVENETMEEFIRETKEKRETRYECCEKKKVPAPKRIIIPLPILDDECEPHTIAVPFRKRPLRNLWKKTSAFILEHYYVAVLQCFISKGNTRSDIKNFNSQFHSWLISKVYPRLEDEKWYPAFGGILRVTETIKRFGAEARLNEPMSHDIAFMFRKGVGFSYEENEETPNSKEKTRDVGDIEFYYPTKTRRYYMLAILIAVAVWLIVFCGCAFFSFGVRDKQSVSYGSTRSRSTPEPSTTPLSQKSDACLPPKKAVSFQFLVRFFKRNQTQETWQVYSTSNEHINGKRALEDSDLGRIERNESNKKLPFNAHNNNQQMMVCGDAPDYSISDLKECEKSSTTCILSFPFRELELPKSVVNAAGEGPVELSGSSQVEPSKKVRTLWRNPCIWPLNVTESRGLDSNNKKKKSWFKLPLKKKKVETTTSETNSRSTDDSRYSSDKRSSSYSCSGRCMNSGSSTTNCTSRTNLEDKCSSATTEFFENVISRPKFRKNGFEQKSSTKSESDYSCTSDNEY